MIGSMTKYAVKLAGQEGLDVAWKHGAWGLGFGSVFGAVSDDETIMSGALKGGVVGAGAAVGMKALGHKYISGLNNRAAQAISSGLHNRSVDNLMQSAINLKANPTAKDATKFLDEAAKTSHALSTAKSMAVGSALSTNLKFADDLGSGWFSSKVSVNSSVTDMANYLKSSNDSWGAVKDKQKAFLEPILKNNSSFNKDGLSFFNKKGDWQTITGAKDDVEASSWMNTSITKAFEKNKPEYDSFFNKPTS